MSDHAMSDHAVSDHAVSDRAVSDRAVSDRAVSDRAVSDRAVSDRAIPFSLDGRAVVARPGESIRDVARREGTLLPHLCDTDAKGYRADGNCRVCMVEIDGERTLAASCIRKPARGMAVHTGSARAVAARNMVMELLLADQPAPPRDRSSRFGQMARLTGVRASRFPKVAAARVPRPDPSHVAMRVNLDACIHCTLCVRACRDVQVNDVIGMAGRGRDAKIAFDLDDPMGDSTCVACGECVEACPTGALMPASLGDTGDRAAVDRSVNSVCPYCGVGCQLTFHVGKTDTGTLRTGTTQAGATQAGATPGNAGAGRTEGIRFVSGRDGPANEGRLCVKGRFGFDYINHPHRLTRPLVRRAGAAKGLNVDPANPLTHFRATGWDEALDMAAGGLARLRDQRGGSAVAGFGSAKCSNEEAYLFQKLIRQGFGHNNLDHCTRLCHASSVAALMENIGSGAVTATFNEIENADVAIAIGCDPVGNHPVAATFFKQFARRGGTLITMDPRAGGLFRHATHRVQFNPGTDVALLNAIMQVILAEGLHDTRYIEAHTENFAAMADHLADYTPEGTAALTGVRPALVRDVARAFAGGRAGMIFWGMGISQHTHGTDNARCLIALALMCGHVGRPGTGLHPLRGQNNVQGASDAGLIPMFLPDYRPVADAQARARLGAVWQTDPPGTEAGLTVVEIMDAIHAGQIGGLYIQGENPAMSDPDVAHARAALARLDHLVVQDIFLTETACYADVVLPAAAWPEKDGTVTNTNRQVQMGRKALEPPGAARADWSITVDMARRLGLDWDYRHPAEVFAEMKRLMPSLDNIGWDRLAAGDAVTYPSHSPDDPGQAVVFGDRFPRPGGRARFTPAGYRPPAESPDSDYPFVLTTGRQLEHWHTGAMTRRATVLDALEPQASASLHPASLARLGVQAGDRLRVITRRGEIQIMARADTAVPQGMVFIPFAYVEAAANILTNPQLDPFGKIPEFKFAAARLVPADGAPAAP